MLLSRRRCGHCKQLAPHWGRVANSLKGVVRVGSDADLVVWNPSARKTISSTSTVSKVGYNIFEGRQVTGLPVVTVSRGKLVWVHGELRAERGAGQYVPRPAFAPMFDALKRQAELHLPQAVVRG